MALYLIILDSVGIGEAPDAEEYGDSGSNTLAHLAKEAGGLNVPVLQSLGLGNIPAIIPNGIPIEGVPSVKNPLGSFGAMQEVSIGKDTTTGHWEIAGIHMDRGFHVFPPEYPSFPDELTSHIEARTGRKLIGNKAASGTEIIQEMGEEQIRNGSIIVYTSADSVFQIAAHEEYIPLEELYFICEVARELCNNYRVGRVIARPYIGTPGNFKRTENRRDYSYPLPAPTILDRLTENNIPVTSVGKIDDIFNSQGISNRIHLESNAPAQAATLELVQKKAQGLVFVNLIDFDMLYGHRRDSAGYAAALEDTDVFLGKMISRMSDDDAMIITADHGNDPTFRGTDHTREFVPLLAFRRGIEAANLGIRKGFFDIAQTVASFFGVDPMSLGKAFPL